MSREQDGFVIPEAVTQTVRVESGFGYGVVGADLHVFQDRGPVYLLTEHRRDPAADTAWLLAQPSRLLNTRFRVVDFTGRESELTELARWRDAAGPRLSARWLHAPGGQGKTRLAAEFADSCLAAGFKVVTVTHGPGTSQPPPGSQDMRLGGSRGLLLVVDYADRWPASHLSWLFSNALLHQMVPTRILLLARSAHAWPAVRSALDDLEADTSDQLLRALPGGIDLAEREQMFTVARDCFAARYNITQMTDQPASLSYADFGLTLTLHMAALAAVDARAHGLQPPEGTAGLSAYLLDRERRHWTRLYENRAEGLEYETTPGEMARVVFTAVLTGASSYRDGTAILERLGMDGHHGRLLADHSTCYPPTDPSTVLEPLYPDRLAEDFLALNLPGRTTAYHVSPWAADTITTLSSADGDGSPPAYLARLFTFLAAAAESDRWPHAAAHLAKILHANPALAVAAGGAVLTAVAGLPDLDFSVLEGIEPHLPERPHIDLDLGIATLTQRLTDHRLATTTDPSERACLYATLSWRYANAGLHAQALAAGEEAVAIRRRLADADPAAHLPDVAASLSSLGRVLTDLGRWEDATAAGEEAVTIRRRLADADPAAHLPDLATALHNLSRGLLGRPEDAVASAEEAVAIRRGLADADPAAYLPDLATSLNNVGLRWNGVGRTEEAAAADGEALAIRRRLADADPAAYLPDLATSLNNFGASLRNLGRSAEALPLTEEAVAIRRRLAKTNPAAYLSGLTISLTNLGQQILALGSAAEALAPVEEAVAIKRNLAETNPAKHLPELTMFLGDLGNILTELGRPSEALTLAEEAVAISRNLAEINPDGFLLYLAKALHQLGTRLSAAERLEEALAATDEAVTIRRRFARTRPYLLPGLAISLGNLIVELLNLGHREQALPLTEELVSSYRSLVHDKPDSYLSGLAKSLHDRGILLSQLGRISEALEPTTEAVTIYRELAEAEPALYLPALGQSLANLRSEWRLRGASAKARGPAEEAVAVYRRLAEAEPDAYLPKLAEELIVLSVVLQANGYAVAEALAATEEAAEIFNRLARQMPRVFKPKLRAARFAAATLRGTVKMQAKREARTRR